MTGPIGTRLAHWRARRGLTIAELAARCGIPAAYLSDLETGRDWLDRRGRLATLAAALQVDPGELTGRPYPPGDPEHARVHATAFHLRRVLAEPPSDAAPDVGGEAAGKVAFLTDTEHAGDEPALAIALPDAIRLATAFLASAPSSEQARRLHLRAHLVAAGLLRRLGFFDLAWVLLQQAARPGSGVPAELVAEEMGILIELGRPGHAIMRAGRIQTADPDIAVAAPLALAHAMTAQTQDAGRVLDAAGERAGDDPRSVARVQAARAVVALETGAPHDAAAIARHIDPAAQPPAERADTLLVTAAAEARTGDITAAAAHLAAAEQAAPLRLRLDPLARELLAVLPHHTTDPKVAEALRGLAARAGL